MPRPLRPAAMHLRDPAADLRVLDRTRPTPDLRREIGQLVQVDRIQLDGARRQPLFDAHVLQIALHQQGIFAVGDKPLPASPRGWRVQLHFVRSLDKRGARQLGDALQEVGAHAAAEALRVGRGQHQHAESRTGAVDIAAAQRQQGDRQRHGLVRQASPAASNPELTPQYGCVSEDANVLASSLTPLANGSAA